MGGGDKALLDLGGRPILGHVINRLRPQVSAMAINANGDPARFGEFGLPVIADTVQGFAGPLAGVLAGLDWAARRQAEFIVTAAADTPFFPPDLTIRLTKAARSAEVPIALAAIPDAQHGTALQPTFGLWSVGLREDLRDALALGIRKILDWTDRHSAARALFPHNERNPFFNVNTQTDLEEAAGILAGDPS